MALKALEDQRVQLTFRDGQSDERTRELSEEQFFKRNGAKKDPEWNAREKPMEVREKWVKMMNAAMERHGHEQRLDPRSWADQGRHDLAELVEPKLLAGSEAEARALHAHVDELREQRAELPAAHLSADKVIEHWEQQAERQIVQVREREAQELSRLDKLIAAAKELASAVQEKTIEVAQNVAERVEQLRDRFERWRGNQVENADQKLNTQSRTPAQEQAAKQQQRAGPELATNAQIEQGRQAFRERYEAYQRERAPAVVPEPTPEPKQEQAIEKKQEQEIKIDRGFGISR